MNDSTNSLWSYNFTIDAYSIVNENSEEEWGSFFAKLSQLPAPAGWVYLYSQVFSASQPATQPPDRESLAWPSWEAEHSTAQPQFSLHHNIFSQNSQIKTLVLKKLFGAPNKQGKPLSTSCQHFWRPFWISRGVAVGEWIHQTPLDCYFMIKFSQFWRENCSWGHSCNSSNFKEVQYYQENISK